MIGNLAFAGEKTENEAVQENGHSTPCFWRSGGRLGCGSELRRQGALKDVGGDNMLVI